MAQDLSAKVSVTVTKEEARRAISALQLLFASITSQTESENFEDSVEPLKVEAERTRKLIEKLRAATK